MPRTLSIFRCRTCADRYIYRGTLYTTAVSQRISESNITRKTGETTFLYGLFAIHLHPNVPLWMENSASFVKDNAGHQVIDEPVVIDGPNAYFTDLPIKAMVEAMREAGVPAANAAISIEEDIKAGAGQIC